MSEEPIRVNEKVLEKPKKLKAAVELGRLGGLVKSERKTAAVRANGKLGGRPRKIKLP